MQHLSSFFGMYLGSSAREGYSNNISVKPVLELVLHIFVRRMNPIFKLAVACHFSFSILQCFITYSLLISSVQYMHVHIRKYTLIFQFISIFPVFLNH